MFNFFNMEKAVTKDGIKSVQNGIKMTKEIMKSPTKESQQLHFLHYKSWVKQKYPPAEGGQVCQIQSRYLPCAAFSCTASHHSGEIWKLTSQWVWVHLWPLKYQHIFRLSQHMWCFIWTLSQVPKIFILYTTWTKCGWFVQNCLPSMSSSVSPWAQADFEHPVWFKEARRDK